MNKIGHINSFDQLEPNYWLHKPWYSMGLSSDHICAPFRGDLNPKWELYNAANCEFRAERLLVRLMNRELVTG